MLGSLLGATVIAYLRGRWIHAEWADLWMPAFLATWVGLIAIVLILDTFQRQQEAREREPERKRAARALVGAMECFLAFVEWSYPNYVRGEHHEVAKLVKAWPVTEFWSTCEPLPRAAERLRMALQQIKDRTVELQASFWNCLAADERETLAALVDGLEEPLGQTPWDLASGTNISDTNAMRGRLSGASNHTRKLLYPAFDLYKALTGKALVRPKEGFGRCWRFYSDEFED